MAGCRRFLLMSGRQRLRGFIVDSACAIARPWTIRLLPVSTIQAASSAAFKSLCRVAESVSVWWNPATSPGGPSVPVLHDAQ